MYNKGIPGVGKWTLYVSIAGSYSSAEKSFHADHQNPQFEGKSAERDSCAKEGDRPTPKCGDALIRDGRFFFPIIILS
jgi:hypothetical protein